MHPALLGTSVRDVHSVTQLCPTLLWPHGMQPRSLLCPWDFPATLLERVAIYFSRVSSQPRDGTQVSHAVSRRITVSHQGCPNFNKGLGIGLPLAPVLWLLITQCSSVALCGASCLLSIRNLFPFFFFSLSLSSACSCGCHWVTTEQNTEQVPGSEEETRKYLPVATEVISFFLYWSIVDLNMMVVLLPNQTWVHFRVQWSPFTDTGLWWRKAQCLLQAPSKEFRQLVLKRRKLLNSFWGKAFKGWIKEGVVGCVISSWTFFWLVGGEVIGSQCHQPSGFNWPGVYLLVRYTQLTSSIWWGFQYLQNSSKNMAQSIIYSP